MWAHVQPSETCSVLVPAIQLFTRTSCVFFEHFAGMSRHVLTGQALFGSLRVGYFQQQHGHVTPCAFVPMPERFNKHILNHKLFQYVYVQWLIGYPLACLRCHMSLLLLYLLCH